MEISANMRRARLAAGSSSHWRKSGKRLFARLLILSFSPTTSPSLPTSLLLSLHFSFSPTFLLQLLLLSYRFSFSPSTTPATPPSFLVLLVFPTTTPSLPPFLLLCLHFYCLTITTPSFLLYSISPTISPSSYFPSFLPHNSPPPPPLQTIPLLS